MKDEEKLELMSKVFWEGGLKTRSVTRGFEIHSDKPRSYFGTNMAPGPMEIFLSSIAACLLTTFIAAAMKARAPVEECNVSIKATSVLSKEKGESITSGRMKLKVWAKEENRSKLEKCFNIAKKTCPLTNAVNFPLEMEFKFKEEK